MYNWQSRETIHPVYEKDSSRILDQGIKRVDGFSQLMAAVVNDTSVMYNTYIPPAFHNDSVHAKPAVQGEKRDSLSPVVASQPVVAVAIPVHGSPEEKKRIRDSIAAVNKALTEARKDSIQNARKLAALQKDSILAVNKALATARKDSIATARKLAAASKDSLLAAEKAIKAAARDSAELAGNKAHAPAEQPVTGVVPLQERPASRQKGPRCRRRYRWSLLLWLVPAVQVSPALKKSVKCLSKSREKSSSWTPGMTG